MREAVLSYACSVPDFLSGASSLCNVSCRCSSSGSGSTRVFLVSGAIAQDDKAKQDKRETRRTPALRNKVYERLAEAQGLAEAKDLRVLRPF